MDYARIYSEILFNALDRETPEGYTEVHHMVPTFNGGADVPSNKIRLTAREHFICHWLLAKYYNTSKAVFAWNCLCRNRDGVRYTSHSFAYARKTWSKKMSELNKDRVFSSETLRKMSAAKIGHTPWNKGVSMPFVKSPERIEYENNPNQCKACGGNIPYNNGKVVTERRKYCSRNCLNDDKEFWDTLKVKSKNIERHPNSGNFEKGRIVPEEDRKKISETMQGLKRPRASCIYCGTEGAVSLLKRWHFDNCKEKP